MGNYYDLSCDNLPAVQLKTHPDNLTSIMDECNCNLMRLLYYGFKNLTISKFASSPPKYLSTAHLS